MLRMGVWVTWDLKKECHSSTGRFGAGILKAWNDHVINNFLNYDIKENTEVWTHSIQNKITHKIMRKGEQRIYWNKLNLKYWNVCGMPMVSLWYESYMKIGKCR